MPARIEDPDQAFLFLLRHPLRRRLLGLYVKEGGMLSPKELADYTKEPLVNVSLHVRVLRDHGAVELVETRGARGAVEHFYKATSFIDEVPWARAALGL
jgi:DNA-binding transcriptional ArsR family regulator